MSAKYPSLRVEGGFLAAEIVDDIAEGKVAGQKPRDFAFTDQTHLIDQISAAWSDARGFWQSFWRRAEMPQPGETGVSFTRAQWAVPFFSLLGYDLTLRERADEIDGLTFAVSHRADPAQNSPPVHVVGAWQSVDRRAESGRPRLAPHSLVQEYLNRTEFLWGIVTNGRILRLLRDSQLIRRQAYIEFNLETMFNGEHFADFALFFRLLHRSRLPHKDEAPQKCLLEGWYQQTIEQGGRVREHLREGVEAAIPALANAILNHPRNTDVRQAASNNELKAQTLYEELLRLVYRLLFLMVTEERNLLCSNAVYRERYSVSRLRRLCENRHARNQHGDLWASLNSTFRLFHSEELGRVLEAPPLNGDIFDLGKTPHLNRASIANAAFLDALWHVAMYREDRRAAPRRINYSALDVEELGSVYESLLDLQPVFTHEDGRLAFSLIKGTERKTTGSYYTHPELVDELVSSALVPVMEDQLRAAKTPKEKERALLEITVCDPACGSGHFLLAAARRLAREVAQVRSGDNEPSPREYRLALRDVISHCIYGVDRNPLAVELCKVALWLESHAEGKPLSFLDHRILCGNSLVGVRNLAILKTLLPDDAFKPVTGDEKEVAKKVKLRNRREGAGSLDFPPARDVTDFTAARKELFDIPDDTPEQVRRKKTVLEQVRSSRKYTSDRHAADLWCTAFFAELTETRFRANEIPTTASVLDALEGRPPYGPMIGMAAEVDYRVRFFHWPLEFPEVFARGGFDAILCNPPWERIKLQQEEFFSSRELTISRAPNKAARERLIRELPGANPSLWQEYSLALHDADSLSRFLRASDLYPLTARGDINTYSVFAERFTLLIRPQGRIGALCPTGIGTDDTNKVFFAEIATSGRLASLYDFENREGLFPAVDSRMRFCLVSVRGATPSVKEPAQFAFFLTRTEQLRDPQRTFPLTAQDFTLLNPNTKTCPVFRTRADAELTRKIYGNIPLLVDEPRGESGDPWGFDYMTKMFDMADSSAAFRTTSQLRDAGLVSEGTRWVSGAGQIWLPLYEAKMIHLFDHRWATFDSDEIRESTLLEKSDPNFEPVPRYWLPGQRVRERLATKNWARGWLMGWRDITNSTNERTSIAAIYPSVAIAHTIRNMFVAHEPRLAAVFVACLSSLVFDYAARQKLGGTHLTVETLKQLPVLPPSAYGSADLDLITGRTLKLVYTSHSIEPFARDLGYEGPPFKWDEDCRAVLRAELDAYFAKLYGLDEHDLRYILDPADVCGADFPGETFRVLKEKEIARFGEYRTRRLVLEAWDRLHQGGGLQ